MGYTRAQMRINYMYQFRYIAKTIKVIISFYLIKLSGLSSTSIGTQAFYAKNL